VIPLSCVCNKEVSADVSGEIDAKVSGEIDANVVNPTRTYVPNFGSSYNFDNGF